MSSTHAKIFGTLEKMMTLRGELSTGGPVEMGEKDKGVPNANYEINWIDKKLRENSSLISNQKNFAGTSQLL